MQKQITFIIFPLNIITRPLPAIRCYSCIITTELKKKKRKVKNLLDLFKIALKPKNECIILVSLKRLFIKRFMFLEQKIED